MSDDRLDTAISVTLWNKWVPVRRETTADGTTSIYFGFGRLSWAKNRRSSTFEMVCLEDDEDGEHTCYLSLGHDGEHVWTPFGNGSDHDG